MVGGRSSRWLPWFFIGPALLLVFVFLVLPTLQTISYSVRNGSMLNPTREFVGLANFERLLTSDRLFLRLDRWPPSGVLIYGSFCFRRSLSAWAC